MTERERMIQAWNRAVSYTEMARCPRSISPGAATRAARRHAWVWLMHARGIRGDRPMPDSVMERLAIRAGYNPGGWIY